MGGKHDKSEKPAKELTLINKTSLERGFRQAIERTQNIFTKVDYPKLVQAIDVHGYRGASNKKHNGVVPIRPEDAKLEKGFQKLLEMSSKFAQELYKSPNATPVKVVAHVENIRLVGLRYPDEDGVHFNLHILGACGYDGKFPL